MKAWLLHWLGATALIDGQRRDIEALEQMIRILIVEHDATRQLLLEKVVPAVHAITRTAMGADGRLRVYESNVPALRKVRDAMMAKERRALVRQIAVSSNGDGPEHADEMGVTDGERPA